MKPLPLPLELGQYPTPVFRADLLSTEHAELWVKNDGVTAPEYGGNKIRKLEWVLSEVRSRGARRIVTTGAGGSHHVLATAIHARKIDVGVTAVLCPQPWTEHAERTLRASLGQGIEVRTVGSMSGVPLGLLRTLRLGDYYLPAGGSNTLGTLAYARAVAELLGQIQSGELPEPDVIVAPLGSGGTVAGLLAGVLREGLPSRVIGVSVAVNAALARSMVLVLARSALRADGGEAGVLRLSRALEVDAGQRGAGYGYRTAAGDHATERAHEIGLTLDATYTAKTFARALAEVRRPSARRRIVLYWHTLSAAPFEPLLVGAPPHVPPPLRKLLPRA